ncbi:MAG: hypothetical protein LBB61_02455, partial [Treponema sp.]|nr:hypothetical protein [Treponema sp.]
KIRLWENALRMKDCRPFIPACQYLFLQLGKDRQKRGETVSANGVYGPFSSASLYGKGIGRLILEKPNA